MIQKICPDCNTVFEYEHKNPEYPDKRKYCDKCKAVKDAAWEAKKNQQLPTQAPAIHTDIPTQVSKPIKPENGEYQSTVYNRNIAANSYEVGRVGNRFKLYFEDAKELQAKMTELKKSGLMDKNIEDLA